MKYRYTRRSRLTASREFRWVFRSPYRVEKQCVTAYARENELSIPRLGLVIAKKQIAKATDRNQIRRIIRESFRLNMHRLSGVDVIIVVRRDTLNLNKQELRVNFDQIWQKLALRYENLLLR